MKLLKTGGTLVFLGFLGGRIGEKIDLGRILLKNLTLTGSVLRSNPIEEKQKLKDDIEKELWPFIKSGELLLPPTISHVYKGIDKVNDALDTVIASKHFGKVIVTIEES